MQIVTEILLDLGLDDYSTINESQLILLDVKEEQKSEFRNLTLGKELSDARAELFVLLSGVDDKEIQEKTSYLKKMHTKELNSQNNNFSTKLQSEQDTKHGYLQERNILKEEIQESRTNNRQLIKKVNSLENDIKEKNSIIDNLHTKISKMIKIGKKIYDRFKTIKRSMKIATEIIPNIKELIQVKIDFTQNQAKQENTQTITPSKGVRL